MSLQFNIMTQLVAKNYEKLCQNNDPETQNNDLVTKYNDLVTHETISK